MKLNLNTGNQTDPSGISPPFIDVWGFLWLIAQASAMPPTLLKGFKDTLRCCVSLFKPLLICFLSMMFYWCFTCFYVLLSCFIVLCCALRGVLMPFHYDSFYRWCVVFDRCFMIFYRCVFGFIAFRCRL